MHLLRINPHVIYLPFLSRMAGQHFQSRWDELERWLAKEHKGFTLGPVTVGQYGQGGEHGVFTTGPVAEGELLSAVPLSAILCPSNPVLTHVGHEGRDPRLT